MTKTVDPEPSKIVSELTQIQRWEDDGGAVNEKHNQRRTLMDKKVGLWLDRKRAVIMSITNNGENRKR